MRNLMKYESQTMLNVAKTSLLLLFILCTAFPCFASVESSLGQIKSQLTGVILPTVSVIGMTFAAISFFTGNPQSKQHIMYAILGCIFGFGAQAIVDLLGNIVR